MRDKVHAGKWVQMLWFSGVKKRPHHHVGAEGMKLLQQLFCRETCPCWGGTGGPQNPETPFQYQKLLLEVSHSLVLAGCLPVLLLLSPGRHTVCTLSWLHSFSPRLSSSPETPLKTEGDGTCRSRGF